MAPARDERGRFIPGSGGGTGTRAGGRNGGLSPEFARDLNAFADRLDHWSRAMPDMVEKRLRQIGILHKAAAQRRVPVDEGTLGQRIVTNTYRDGDEIVTETGANVKYAIYVEFGTEHIAGGQVKALGEDPHITDEQAIKSWPAKEEDNSENPLEMMPWLRPAFVSILDTARRLLGLALKPPRR